MFDVEIFTCQLNFLFLFYFISNDILFIYFYYLFLIPTESPYQLYICCAKALAALQLSIEIVIFYLL